MKQGQHILLMGDTREYKNIAKQLIYEGFDVDVVESGKACIYKYKKHMYDIVMLSSKMPAMTGIDVAKKIRQMEIEKKTYTPIVLITNTDINFRNAILNGINWCMNLSDLNINEMLITLNKFKLI